MKVTPDSRPQFLEAIERGRKRLGPSGSREIDRALGFQRQMTKHLPNAMARQNGQKSETASSQSAFVQAAREAQNLQQELAILQEKKVLNAARKNYLARARRAKGKKFIEENLKDASLLVPSSNKVSIPRVGILDPKSNKVRKFPGTDGVCAGRCHAFLAQIDFNAATEGDFKQMAVETARDARTYFAGALRHPTMTQAMIKANLKVSHIPAAQKSEKGWDAEYSRSLDSSYPEFSHAVKSHFIEKGTRPDGEKAEVKKSVLDFLAAHDRVMITGYTSEGSHSLACVRHGDDNFILDPNFGLFKQPGTPGKALSIVEASLDRLYERGFVLVGLNPA